MSISLHYNSAAGFVRQNLEKATFDTGRHSQRLSTGVKINSASDDAAGLGLSKKISAQVSSSDMAKNNVQTGVNMLQTLDSDLAVIGDILQRRRDLAVQSANGVYSGSERRMLDSEYVELGHAVYQVLQSSSFLDNKLMQGGSIALQAGTNNTSSDRINFDLPDGYSDSAIFDTYDTDNHIDSDIGARACIQFMDAGLDWVSQKRGAVGATINSLSSRISRTDSRQDNLSDAASNIVDADMAVESAGLTKGQILKQSSVSLLQQVNKTSGETALTLLKQ